MFTFKIDNNHLLCDITLPEKMTQREIIGAAKEELKLAGISICYGHDLFITGRITTSLAGYICHYFAHIAKRIFIFDPKENEYVCVVEH